MWAMLNMASNLIVIEEGRPYALTSLKETMNMLVDCFQGKASNKEIYGVLMSYITIYEPSYTPPLTQNQKNMKKIKGGMLKIGGLVSSALSTVSDYLTNTGEAGESESKETETVATTFSSFSSAFSGIGNFVSGFIGEKSGDKPNAKEDTTKSTKRAQYQLAILAKQGDANAQYFLGVCYENGKGVPKKLDKAVFLYRKAAEQGHPKAQCSLGLLYHYGRGVEQDFKQAAQWLKKAAEQGEEKAQYFLELPYYKGI